MTPPDETPWWIRPPTEAEMDFYVGNKCFVRCTDSTMLMGDPRGPIHEQGRILLRKPGGDTKLEVEIVEAPLYRHQDGLRGQRASTSLSPTTETYDKFKYPLPEVGLLIALLSDSAIERSDALTRFVTRRKTMAKQVLKCMETVLRAYESESKDLIAWPPDEEVSEGDAYPAILDFEPELFRYFVGQWMSIIVKKNSMKELSSWETAARQVMERLARIRRSNKPTKQDDDGPYAQHPRVFAAIKRATLECADLPHHNLICEFVDKDGGKAIPSDRVRSIRTTLGFSWIPGKPDWDKYWKLKRPKGWG